MTDQTKLHFYALQQKLFMLMTEPYSWDSVSIRGVLAEICKLFRLCRGEATFYKSIRHDSVGQGETVICYNDGRRGKPAVSIRFVSRSSAVICGTAYIPEDEEPLSEEEYDLVYFSLRSALCLLSFERLQKVVEQLSFHDDNGFRNARCFNNYIMQLSDQHKLNGKTALHYNLRHFSLINQEIGRNAGDIVIRNHYNGLSELIGDAGIVCRLGGDNFIAFCDSSTLEKALEYLTETPIICNPNSGKRIMVAASVGVYVIPENTVLRDPNEIMDKIIPASLAARNGGKDRIVYFSKDLQGGKEKAMRIQQRFPEALRNEEFQVYYQPKIDVETGMLSGAEALCRWFHNNQLISPGDFIPVLEETTEICKLDFYMLDHVCRDIRRWLDEGRSVVRISVNLSRKHMMDIDLLKNILEIIDSHNVPHEYIEIELTETTTDVEFRDLKRVVRGLQQAGIYTSVDDFGVGYSSLNLIREIPWNVLKIDRSFLPTQQGETNRTSEIMFKYVVAMAKELGLECISEGVETEQQLALLRVNHCGLAQGFLFDRPLAVRDFEDRLNGHIYPTHDDIQA